MGETKPGWASEQRQDITNMKTTELGPDEVKQTVRERYGKIAGNSGFGCAPSCCSPETTDSADASRAAAAVVSQRLGYSAADTEVVPDGANLGLGCGNPIALASLRPGQTVLDLGSGAGFDAFLAARTVGAGGSVIGVDMTPEMIAKARANQARGDYGNVEFRLGEIEALPVADASVDVIISNCVINLSPDKPRVFAETWRVLKPGGRLAISDVVAFAELPEAIRQDLALYTGCMAGASLVSEVEAMLAASGFTEIQVTPKDASRSLIQGWAPGTDVADYVVSAMIEAIKPAA